MIVDLMEPASEEKIRFLGWTLYPLGFFLILGSAMQVFLAVWPPRLGDLHWRFGTVGLFSDALVVPALGLFLIVLGAHLLQQRWAQILLVILTGSLAIIFAGTAALFLLDTLQLQNQVAAEASAEFWSQVAKSLIQQGLATVLLGILAVGGYKLWRIDARQSRGKKKSGGKGLVIPAQPPQEP